MPSRVKPAFSATLCEGDVLLGRSQLEPLYAALVERPAGDQANRTACSPLPTGLGCDPVARLRDRVIRVYQAKADRADCLAVHEHREVERRPVAPADPAGV